MHVPSERRVDMLSVVLKVPLMKVPLNPNQPNSTVDSLFYYDSHSGSLLLQYLLIQHITIIYG